MDFALPQNLWVKQTYCVTANLPFAPNRLHVLRRSKYLDTRNPSLYFAPFLRFFSNMCLEKDGVDGF
jgi:hypothetical protein